MQGRDLAVIIITGDGQYRDVYMGVFIFIRHHLLPVAIVSGMLQPALQPLVGRTINTVYFSVRNAAGIPFLLHRPPSLVLIICCMIEVFVIGNKKGPSIIGI